MKITQLSLADYNSLDNIPVVNQDLAASGFTPVADTYYRHTGVTGDVYTKGLLYYYNGTEFESYATKEEVNAKQNALTEEQLAAVNSGITSEKVVQYDSYKATIDGKANTSDLVNYAKKADVEDITGAWKFSTAPKMNTLENENGNAMYHFNGERAFFGQTTFPTVLRGSLARPQYTTDGTTFKDLAKIEDVYNPNLLINPNFAINQRGQTSYTATASPYYTVDRWCIRAGNTVSIQDNSVTLDNSNKSTDFGIYQSIENFENTLLGKNVTISVKIASLNGSAKIGMSGGSNATSQAQNPFQTGSADITISAAGVFSLTRTLKNKSDFTNDYLNLYILATADSIVVVEWVKLEIGSVATEFSPPSIAEELAKCLRYYYKMDASAPANRYDIYTIAGTTYSFTSPLFVFPLPMRRIPTITLYSSQSQAAGVLYNTTKGEDKTFDVQYVTDTTFIIQDPTGGLSVGDVVTGYYSADAEI